MWSKMMVGAQSKTLVLSKNSTKSIYIRSCVMIGDGTSYCIPDKYLDLYVKNGSEEVAANMSPRPKSESAVLSVSLPPSVEKIHFKTADV